MAKLEIPVVVDIDAVEELVEELKHLQTYKLDAGDDLILVDRDAVVEIFAMHVKAKQREERKTGRWIRRPYDGIYCTACGKGWSFMLGAPGDVEENYRYCPHCGAVMMEGEADG